MFQKKKQKSINFYSADSVNDDGPKLWAFF